MRQLISSVTRRLARGPSRRLKTTPSFTAGLSQVRPEKTCREKREFKRVKQRQVDILTKSSLGLPLDRTAVYIQRDFRSHGRDMESQRIIEKRVEGNRAESNRDRNAIERGRTE